MEIDLPAVKTAVAAACFGAMLLLLATVTVGDLNPYLFFGLLPAAAYAPGFLLNRIARALPVKASFVGGNTALGATLGLSLGLPPTLAVARWAEIGEHSTTHVYAQALLMMALFSSPLIASGFGAVVGGRARREITFFEVARIYYGCIVLAGVVVLRVLKLKL